MSVSHNVRSGGHNSDILHGPPMLVDKTNFGLVLYNHASFYRFEETSSYWLVERISVFLCFSFGNLRHTSVITVYNRTVTNIENLCGPCWFSIFFNMKAYHVFSVESPNTV